MFYDIQVRPGPDTGFFQYYTETVEAATSHDAISRVQRANPGCIVTCCRSYSKPSGGGSSFSIGDIDGNVTLIGIVVALWLIIEYWWIVVPIAAITLVGWLYTKFSDN
jgi:hypothetical protein